MAKSLTEAKEKIESKEIRDKREPSSELASNIFISNLASKQSISKQSSKYSIIERFQTLRNFSKEIASPLQTEDYMVQTMNDVSPTKWHLAHTTWFFETFILEEFLPKYSSPYPIYKYLFNSYYNRVGPQHQRDQRGWISRPSVQEVYEYRDYVEESVLELLEKRDEGDPVFSVVELGIHHEQQHQELMLTDIKHVFFSNPLRPSYNSLESNHNHQASGNGKELRPFEWNDFEGGVVVQGYTGSDFCYDNEKPTHRVFLEPFSLASRPILNGDYLEFIESASYKEPSLWLSDGFKRLSQLEEFDRLPLYWEKRDQEWWTMTLSGMKRLDPYEPVCHVNYYEADAYARFRGFRLPTESEWEFVAKLQPMEGHFVESKSFHPSPLLMTEPKQTDKKVKKKPQNDYSNSEEKIQKELEFSSLFGNTWEWTQSHYSPYPGFKASWDAIGEYNGKFMCNQFVLRGGSCVSSKSHIRASYRNFFPPDAQWQFTGIRLAKSI